MLGAVLLAACSLTTTFEGLSSGDRDAAREAGVTSEPGLEASTEDGGSEADAASGTLTPVVIASDVGGQYATGAAQQMHLQYAKNAAKWVLFYTAESDPTHLRTRMSSDFATWSEGPALSLPQPHPVDGRSFAVTYAEIAGRDVFHLSLSLMAGQSDRRHHHVRAAFAGSELVFETVTELSRTSYDTLALDPDGPAVAVLAGGTVLDVSGWYAPDGGTARTGNMVSFHSTQGDTAATWSPVFAPMIEVETVPTVCNARVLAVVPGGGALALWEAGDVDPSPTRLTAARFANGVWTAPGPVGFEAEGFDVNDWSAAALDGEVHAVRATQSVFAHRVFADGSWRSGVPMPARTHPPGQGVLVLSDAARVRVATVDADGTIASTTLSGGTWSAWQVVLPARGRIRLSGTSGPGGLALQWLELTGARKDIVAMRWP